MLSSLFIGSILHAFEFRARQIFSIRAAQQRFDEDVSAATGGGDRSGKTADRSTDSYAMGDTYSTKRVAAYGSMQRRDYRHSLRPDDEYECDSMCQGSVYGASNFGSTPATSPHSDGGGSLTRGARGSAHDGATDGALGAGSPRCTGASPGGASPPRIVHAGSTGPRCSTAHDGASAICSRGCSRDSTQSEAIRSNQRRTLARSNQTQSGGCSRDSTASSGGVLRHSPRAPGGCSGALGHSGASWSSAGDRADRDSGFEVAPDGVSAMRRSSNFRGPSASISSVAEEGDEDEGGVSPGGGLTLDDRIRQQPLLPTAVSLEGGVSAVPGAVGRAPRRHSLPPGGMGGPSSPGATSIISPGSSAPRRSSLGPLGSTRGPGGPADAAGEDSRASTVGGGTGGGYKRLSMRAFTRANYLGDDYRAGDYRAADLADVELEEFGLKAAEELEKVARMVTPLMASLRAPRLAL